LALAIGLISGVLCAAVQFNAGSTAGDFTWAWRAANDLLAGRDVYQQAFGDDKVPYPLPAAFAALPFAFLPPQIALSGVGFFATPRCGAVKRSRDGLPKCQDFLARAREEAPSAGGRAHGSRW
jgi:hypothetical protein